MCVCVCVYVCVMAARHAACARVFAACAGLKINAAHMETLTQYTHTTAHHSMHTQMAHVSCFCIVHLSAAIMSSPSPSPPPLPSSSLLRALHQLTPPSHTPTATHPTHPHRMHRMTQAILVLVALLIRVLVGSDGYSGKGENMRRICMHPYYRCV